MFEIYKVKEEEKEVIYNLMQIYTYELSFYEDETVSFKMLDNGLYKISKYVDLYWKEEKRSCYSICDSCFSSHSRWIIDICF